MRQLRRDHERQQLALLRPALQVRYRLPEEGDPHAHGAREDPRLLRPHRAYQRLRRAHHAHRRREAGRRRLPPERLEELHHLRPRGRAHHRLRRHHAAPRQAAPHRADRPPRLGRLQHLASRREARDQGRALLVDLLRQRAGAEGEHPRRRGRGLQDRHGHARRRAHRHRGAGHRDRARSPRKGRRILQGAQGVPHADLQPASDPVHDRRHGRRPRRGPSAHAPRRDDEGQGRPPHGRERHGQALRVRDVVARDAQGPADPRRLRLRHRVRRRARHARRAHHRDLEGTSEIQRIVIAASVLKA